MDITALKSRLIEAIDEVFRDLETNSSLSAGTDLLLTTGDVLPVEGGFDFRWPEETVHYEPAFSIPLNDGAADYSFLMGWQTRPAFGKEERGRWIVFHQWGGSESAPYPVAEFTETDDGRFAAIMLATGGSRKRLYPDDELPEWFKGLDVARTDELYETVRNGPSLRVIVADKDFDMMVAHGYWMARTRAILPGGQPTGAFRMAS